MNPATLVFSVLALFLFSGNPGGEWTPMLDRDLSQWETYLSYSHTSLAITGPPKDSNGVAIKPVGLNHDTAGVFTVIEENGELILRVSGQIYGCLGSLKEYENYDLKLKVKWGARKWPPRLHEPKDSGLLYHSIGPYGADYWLTWRQSHEFQIMQQCFGDYWSIAGTKMDIRARLPEGEKAYIYDEHSPLTSSRANGQYCRRSKDCEQAEGEWNTIELICFGDRSLHIVNGTVVMALEHSRYLKAGVETPLTKGAIQIQCEGAETYYKDIQIRSIDAFPNEYASYFGG